MAESTTSVTLAEKIQQVRSLGNSNIELFVNTLVQNLGFLPIEADINIVALYETKANQEVMVRKFYVHLTNTRLRVDGLIETTIDNQQVIMRQTLLKLRHSPSGLASVEYINMTYLTHIIDIIIELMLLIRDYINELISNPTLIY